MSSESRKILESRVGVDISTEDGIKPTKLYPHRRDVTQENKASLLSEIGEILRFTATDTGDTYNVQQLDSNCQAPKILELKIGCQVMLLKNLDFKSSLVNGSRGIVVGFTTDPDKVGINDPLAEEIYPVVRFSDSRDHIINYETWKIELAGQVRATRYQIPLTLAYALSIHKSQGMSIEKVDLSLSNVFAYGQVYVALSRVISLEGLKLSSFSPNVIKAHPKVIKFYSTFKETTSGQIDGYFTKPVEPPSFWSDEEIDDNVNTRKEITNSSSILKPLSLPKLDLSIQIQSKLENRYQKKNETNVISSISSHFTSSSSCGNTLSRSQLPMRKSSNSATSFSSIDLT